MTYNKSFLLTVLSVALLAGCTTVEEKPNTDNIATTTSVDGVKVTSVAYKCRIDQSESESQGQFEKPFLIEYSGQEQAMLVERSGSYPLTRVESASGSKYASVDGMQIFWEKGDKATITLNHETFNDCFLVK
ncbi:MliC family protein [Vibrio rumoiensis]|uniref:MliC family protein n=1 Tax=Vibrio rumoiensis TaxID=76258 RepID=UPI000B5C825A|nr:MliC family protein [Vibrio rumoiensis]